MSSNEPSPEEFPSPGQVVSLFALNDDAYESERFSTLPVDMQVSLLFALSELNPKVFNERCAELLSATYLGKLVNAMHEENPLARVSTVSMHAEQLCRSEAWDQFMEWRFNYTAKNGSPPSIDKPLDCNNVIGNPWNA